MIQLLKGNLLFKTKCLILSLHQLYIYESGFEFGISFSNYVKHFSLYLISYLHIGRKLWRIIPPLAADAFIKKLKELDSEITQECNQYVRYVRVFMPVLTLKEQGIPFTILNQKVSEIIITVLQAYYSGFSTGYTLTEAVNYVDREQILDTYTSCLTSCPDYLILADYLAFLRPGEKQ